MAAADQRVVASAVLSQVNSEDLRIIFRLFSDDAQQIVRRAVVDGNDLISKIRPFRDDLTNFIYDESYGPFAVTKLISFLPLLWIMSIFTDDSCSHAK